MLADRKYLRFDFMCPKHHSVELIDCSNVVQGAPETLRGMLARVPEDYDQNYLTMSRRGARVLALGWRDLGPLSHQELKVQAIGWLPECSFKCRRLSVSNFQGGNCRFSASYE